MVFLLSLLACVSSRCGEVETLPSADVVAIGDSILAWREPKCQSVPDHASSLLGARIDNRSINGAQLLGGEDAIPDQLGDSTASTVLLTGGGNDLNAREVCDGADPTEVLDLLVSEDGSTGAMPGLVDALTAEGREVWLLLYYDVREQGWYGLGACGEEVALLKERYVRLAESRPSVHTLDLADTVHQSDRDLYDFDHVHPSKEGAEVLGAAVAEALSGP